MPIFSAQFILISDTNIKKNTVLRKTFYVCLLFFVNVTYRANKRH